MDFMPTFLSAYEPPLGAAAVSPLVTVTASLRFPFQPSRPARGQFSSLMKDSRGVR